MATPARTVPAAQKGTFTMAKKGQLTVTIERHISQVEEGKKYAGYLDYLGTRLDFMAEFPRSIESMNSTKLTSVAEAREFCRIEIKKGDTVLRVEDDEYPDFLFLIASLAWDFAQNPQTMATNHSSMSSLLKQFGGSIEASMTVTQGFGITIGSALLRPKFGAKLPDL